MKAAPALEQLNIACPRMASRYLQPLASRPLSPPLGFFFCLSVYGIPLPPAVGVASVVSAFGSLCLSFFCLWHPATSNRWRRVR